MAVHSQGPRRLGKSPPGELAHGNVKPTKGTSLGNAPKNCGKTILLLHVVRELQLTEKKKKKKKKKTKSEKRRWLFLHNGALALASKVSSGHCTVPLLHRQCLSPVLTSVPEWRYFSVVLRYTNNHHHPYIDSTTVLSDNVNTNFVSLAIYVQYTCCTSPYIKHIIGDFSSRTHCKCIHHLCIKVFLH